MSVPKSRRNESKIEFDATYFKVMKDAVELTANHFGASENTYINNKLYTDITCKSILECAESLLVKKPPSTLTQVTIRLHKEE